MNQPADAIREDVPGEQPIAADTPTPTENTNDGERRPYVSARESAMDRIAATRNAKFAEETGVAMTPEPTPEPTPAPAAATPPATDPQLAAQLADDDQMLDESMLSRKVKLKIDGREELVPLEQLVRGEQKWRAADARLAEATRLMREARAKEQSAPSQETAGTNPQAQPADLSALRATVTSRVKDALGNVFNGNEDEAVEKLVEAVLAVGGQPTSAPQPVIDVGQITQTVKSELERESALAQFASRYPRIVGDPDLPVVADRTLVRLQSEEGLSFADALERTGQDLYARFGWQTVDQQRISDANAQPTTGRTQQVATRKAGIDVPVGRMVSAAGTAASPESSEQSRSQTIAEIAASRAPQPLARRVAAQR